VGEPREQDYRTAPRRGKQWEVRISEVLQKVFYGQVDIAEDGTQKAGAKCFTRVHRNSSHPAIWMSQKYVTAAGSNYLKPDSSQSAHSFLSSEPRETSHTEICWMPTSSSELAFCPASSRHNSTTSCTRFIRVSRFLA
jgi:hypothetical protein